MVYISYDKSWRSAFYYNVSARDRVQDINLAQLKLKVNDTYGKDDKIPTTFDVLNDEDVINTAYLDTKISKTEGHSSLMGGDYNEYKLGNDKDAKHTWGLERPYRPSEKNLFKRAVKKKIQVLFDKGLCNK